jgi:hypothetical protein
MGTGAPAMGGRVQHAQDAEDDDYEHLPITA